MSLERSIAAGKEHRKPFHGSAIVDATCRTGGNCPYCRDNRTHKHSKQQASSDQQIAEFEEKVKP